LGILRKLLINNPILSL